MSKYRAWLVYDREARERNRDYIELHRQVGEKFGIEFKLVDPDRLDYKDLDRPDFAIVRSIRPEFSREIEKNGIPVFNNSTVARICNDKYKTLQYIKKMDPEIPTIPSSLIGIEDLTPKFLRDHPGQVVKAVDGHGGQEVFRTEEDFSLIKEAMGQSQIIVQPFIQGPGKDVRVYVLGREMIGAIERTSLDGFRSNFSLGGSVREISLNKAQKDLVNRVIACFDFGLVGIDFILDQENNFVLSEIEDVVGARMLYKCRPDIDLLERYFSFIIEKILH
ncbi:MAG: ATP-grasp domain-containing protein [Eubacterium sp.]|nr:ATP-grasp domain-containing protein [Eubacterium sp.]